MKTTFKVVIASTLISLGLYVITNLIDSNDRPLTTEVDTVKLPLEKTPDIKGSVDKKVILNLHLNEKRTLYLTQPVSMDVVDDLVNKLRQMEKTSSEPVYLLIDSPGGSVFDGAQLVSQMESMRAPVHTVCLKICASMAAIIHQYGKKRYALDRSVLMFHPASGAVQGQVGNMINRLKTINRYVNKFNQYIINRSGINEEEFNKIMSYELWVDAEDAKTTNFLDNIVSIDLPLNVPERPLGTDKMKLVHRVDVQKFDL